MNQISKAILLVDDDRNLLDALKRRFRNSFDITVEESPHQAMKMVVEREYAVVVSDYQMPQMSGVEFLREVRSVCPDTVTIMLTGNTDIAIAVSALHEGSIFRFLSKPCSTEMLAKSLEDGLEQYRLVRSEHFLSAQLNMANANLKKLNEGLEHLVDQRTATIRGLHQFVSQLNGLISIEQVAELVTKTASQMLQCRRVSLMMPDSGGECLRVVAAVGLPDEIRERTRVMINEPIAGIAFANGHDIIANTIGQARQLVPDSGRYETDCFASVPLVCAAIGMAGSNPVGVLNITERVQDRPFEDEDIRALHAITEAAAIALLNQIRLRERNEARDAVILAMAKLAENRDPETGTHLERVQSYCRVLSEALATTPKYEKIIDRAFIENIVRSSPLHDIGKVGIPDNILLKPGRLTPEEFDVMKRHSTIGGDTIRALIEQGRNQSFLQMGMEIAYHHHERYNGKGYPDGLAGEDIPLSARIMALANVYDALTSRRVYKEPMPHEQAAAIIREDTGTHFDPDVAWAFWEREAEFKRLSIALVDTPETLSRSGPQSKRLARELAGTASQ